MKFRTEYLAEKAPFCIDPSHPTVLLGSCFADNMAMRMRSCLWEAENPMGTLYNPLSIAAALEIALETVDMLTNNANCFWGKTNEGTISINDKNVTEIIRGINQLKGTDLTSLKACSRFEESLFEGNGLWRSWLFDSKLAAETDGDVRLAFIERSLHLHSLLSRAEVLFVTFGTSWCYYLSNASDYSVNTDYLVANCHKQPASSFIRSRLEIEEIVEKWSQMLDFLKGRYPELKVVFTVSPVRHLKDGFAGNSQSKAILLLAVEKLCEKNAQGFYFPAYEIVNDDLRDYRFYASDLVHPSDEAVEYLWEIFKETFIDDKGLRWLKEGEAIRKGLEHRPLPNATRIPSSSAVERERTRIAALEERKRKLLNL